MPSRRELLAGSALFMATTVARSALAQGALPTTPGVPDGVATEAGMEALPGKKPMIRLSNRPPNFESPLSTFGSTITPNDEFFVRYHLSDIPQIDAAKWSLKITGGQNPLTLTLAQLKADYPAVEVTAVCQCSGNRRGLSNPHVPGVQWGFGAMGNARWKGARLKDVLAKAGVPASAVEIVVNGADGPAYDKTPDFIKSLPVWKATDDNTIIAYEMNGEPLPHWNGFPARLVVPGWTATYWMKHLTEVQITDKPYEGFWMKGAYRLPLGLFPSVDRFVSQESPVNTPITEMMVNSIITSPADGAKVQAGAPLTVRGVAWDGGRGIDRVEVSIDGGTTWAPAKLGDDPGRFSFRAFSLDVGAAKAGPVSLMARATNKAGQTQVSAAIFNAPGYHHNVIHRVGVTVG